MRPFLYIDSDSGSLRHRRDAVVRKVNAIKKSSAPAVIIAIAE